MMNLNQEAVQNIKISYCVKWKCLNLIVAGHLEVLVLRLPSPRHVEDCDASLYSRPQGRTIHEHLLILQPNQTDRGNPG